MTSRQEHNGGWFGDVKGRRSETSKFGYQLMWSAGQSEIPVLNDASARGQGFNSLKFSTSALGRAAVDIACIMVLKLLLCSLWRVWVYVNLGGLWIGEVKTNHADGSRHCCCNSILFNHEDITKLRGYFLLSFFNFLYSKFIILEFGDNVINALILKEKTIYCFKLWQLYDACIAWRL